MSDLTPEQRVALEQPIAKALVTHASQDKTAYYGSPLQLIETMVDALAPVVARLLADQLRDGAA